MPSKRGLLSKCETRYLLEKLRALDVEVMRAFVVKLVQEKEAVHIDYYKARKELWLEWRSTGKLDILLKFLHQGFMKLFQQHSTGAERFSRLLVAWHNFVGSLACSALSNELSQAVWVELTSASSEVNSEDRSAAVFAVATCVYTFMQKEVGKHL